MYVNNPTLDYLPETVLNLIPKHKKGNSRDTISFITVDSGVALSNFTLIKQRLLNVNNWSEFCTKTPVKFEIHDSSGNFRDRYVKLNDSVKIQISIPSISNRISDLVTDWVVVNRVEEKDNEDTSLFLIQLVPVDCPENNKEEVKHFYENCASNTFILFRNKEIISLSIHGRNESLNLKTNSKLKLIRNFLVANLGYLGIDNLLWFDFANKILKS